MKLKDREAEKGSTGCLKQTNDFRENKQPSVYRYYEKHS